MNRKWSLFGYLENLSNGFVFIFSNSFAFSMYTWFVVALSYFRFVVFFHLVFVTNAHKKNWTKKIRQEQIWKFKVFIVFDAIEQEVCVCVLYAMNIYGWNGHGLSIMQSNDLKICERDIRWNMLKKMKRSLLWQQTVSLQKKRRWNDEFSLFYFRFCSAQRCIKNGKLSIINACNSWIKFRAIFLSLFSLSFHSNQTCCFFLTRSSIII